MKATVLKPCALRSWTAHAVAVIAVAVMLTSTNTTHAGPPIGINTDWVTDYSGDVVFADAMKASRQWSTTNLDANGWPQQDANIYVWADVAHDMSGTYALSFEGQADISGATVTGKSWNSGTNITTGTITLGSTSTLQLTFSNTRRTAGSGLNTGIANVKLMRPTAPGAGTSYSTTTAFTTQSKALYSKFSVIRFMDWLQTNANPSTTWSGRTRPAWATQFRWNGDIWTSSAMGASWEYAVQFCNETNADLWICIPVAANDDYVTKLAQLIAYGSDGNLPYTSTQASPVFAPLNASRKVYLEFSNELWNSAPGFGQFQTNVDAATAEVNAGGSPLNFDGSTSQWDWAARRSVKRTVEIGNIFRAVFGSGAMMTRIRPVLESQQGYTGWWHYQQSRLLEDYYNNPTRVATPQPPSYYVYGGGGSAYYNPQNDDAGLTINSIWSSATFNAATWVPICNLESAYALSLYGNRIAYEGGPSMDACGCAADAVKQQAWADARMTTTLTDHQTTWDQTGGGLLIYYKSSGDYRWGFTTDAYILNTRKLIAVDQINASTPAVGTSGTAIPGTVTASSFQAPETFGVSVNALSASGATSSTWLGYLVRNATAGTFSIALSAGSAGAGNQADIYVDGAFVGTLNIANTGSNTSYATTSTVTTASLAVGTHGLKVKAKTGTFGVQSIIVTSGGGGGTPPGAPGTLSATAGNAQVSLSWGAASGATSYNVYRGTSPGGESPTPIATGITSTGHTDSGLTNGTTYYYKVAGVNTNGTGPQSNETSATPTNGGGGGSSQVITSVRFYPRSGITERMTNGQFQGSNDNTSWTTLATVATQPPNNAWTTLSVSNTTAWRYVRYLSPNNSWGNVAEIEFYNGATKLTGTGFGTAGSWNNSGNTFDKAIDNNTATFFDSPNANGSYVGYDFGAGGGSPPAAPANLTATLGNAQIALSWNASATATSYNVYRGTSAGGESATPIATGITGTSHTDTGLTNGTTYYYKVAGVNSSGTGPQSNEASATPVSPPATPTGLSATPGNAEVALTWNASSGATAYDVKRATTNGGPYSIIISPTTTSYTDTGLTNGTTYYYVVAAKNAGGSSANTAQVSAIPSAGGGAQVVTSVRFYPRSGITERMTGGQFQGSNNNSTWTTLATVTTQPPNNTWTTLSVSNTTAWRYLRYLSPNNSWGNVSEIEFYNGTTKLTGTGFGTPGSWNNSGNTFDKAIDGNTATFFDSPNANGSYVGIDRGP